MTVGWPMPPTGTASTCVGPNGPCNCCGRLAWLSIWLFLNLRRYGGRHASCRKRPVTHQDREACIQRLVFDSHRLISHWMLFLSKQQLAAAVVWLHYSMLVASKEMEVIASKEREVRFECGIDDNTWSDVIISNHIWLHMIPHHHVQSHMVTCDHAWSHMILYDHRWSFMIIYDHVNSYVIVHNNIWKYICTCICKCNCTQHRLKSAQNTNWNL